MEALERLQPDFGRIFSEMGVFWECAKAGSHCLCHNEFLVHPITLFLFWSQLGKPLPEGPSSVDTRMLKA